MAIRQVNDGGLPFVVDSSRGEFRCYSLALAEAVDATMNVQYPFNVGDNVTTTNGTLVGTVGEIINIESVLVYWPGNAGIVSANTLRKV